MKYIIKITLAFLIFNGSFSIINAQVGINTDQSDPAPSAMLDIKSSDKGLLIPRMTTEERDLIESPAEGLLVYDENTYSFWYFQETWTELNPDLNMEFDGTSILVRESVSFENAEDVSSGDAPDEDDSSIVSGEVWQSFTPTTNGELTKIRVTLNDDDDLLFNGGYIRIYEGEGVAGNLLTQLAIGINVSDDLVVDFDTESAALQKDSMYTFSLQDTVNNQWTQYYTNGYAGGRASFSANSDLIFTTYMSLDTTYIHEAISFDRDGASYTMNLNAVDTLFFSDGTYQITALPDPNGSSHQMLITDANGTILWDDLVSDTDNQTIDLFTLFGNDLHLSLEDDNETNQSVDLSQFLDNTDDQQIDKFELANTTLSLSLEDDGEADYTVDLASLNTDNQQIDKFELANTTLSLSLEDDGETDYTVDLASLNTDNQQIDKFELANTTLSLSLEDDSEADYNVDLSMLQDQLGDHIATQNLQLADNWVSNDGDKEGIGINDDGNVGIGVDPTDAILSVRLGKDGVEVQGAANSSAGNVFDDVGSIWQSYTATTTGELTRVDFRFYDASSTRTVTIYSGEGTDGEVLGTSTADVTGSGVYIIDFDFSTEQIEQIEGNIYTIALDEKDRFYVHINDPYDGGMSSIAPEWDIFFRTYTQGYEAGFQVSDNGVAINDYTLPQADGAANQILTTDGNGTLSWIDETNDADDLGNHTANQNLQLSDFWLSNDGGNEGIQIDNDGNVGIGTASPAALLDLSDGSGNNDILLRFNTERPWQYEEAGTGLNSTLILRSSSSGKNFNMLAPDGNAIASFRAVDGADNKVGINKTIGSFDNTLEVNGTASKATAGDWLANSDIRLKKNIQQLDSEQILQKLLSLQGVTYEWNDDKTGTTRPEGVQYGFSAQNIQAVFPHLVTEDAQGFLQTAYGTYDAMYVEAFRALKNENTTLENTLKEQQSQIENLKMQLEEVEHLKQQNAEMKTMLQQIQAQLNHQN